MIQHVIILTLFALAVIYLGYLLYQQFYVKKDGCAGNCGCSAMELDKLEKEIRKNLAKKTPGQS